MSVKQENALFFKVSRLPEGGLEFERRFPREWLTNIPEFLDDADTHLEGEIEVSGRLSFEGSHLRLVGRVEAQLQTVCSRCGEPVRYRIDSRFELRLVQGSAGESADEEEVSLEELDENFFQGEELDLAPYFQEEIALQAPNQVLCSEGCKGLCPTCGRNRNQGDCDCRDHPLDPRLEALRKLKLEN